MNTTDLKSFHYLENGEISFSCFDTVRTTKQLEPGFYNLSTKDDERGYPKVSVQIDSNKEEIKMYNFPDKKTIENITEAFFNPKVIAKIAHLGFNHKLGIMLHGNEGTGKSTIARFYANKMITDHNAIVFYCTSSYRMGMWWDFVLQIRRIQNNPVVIIFEEFDNFITDGRESELKLMLDGNRAINNSVCFATTNYINVIPKAIAERPSRFKYSFCIEGIQDKSEIYNLLVGMLDDVHTNDEINSFIPDLIGKSLDSIKQFCLDRIMAIDTVKDKKRPMGFRAHM